MKVTVERIGEMTITAVKRNRFDKLLITDLRTLAEISRRLEVPIKSARLEYFDIGYGDIEPRWMLWGCVDIPEHLEKYLRSTTIDFCEEIALDIVRIEDGARFGTKDIIREYWSQFGIALDDLLPDEKEHCGVNWT